MSTPKSIRRRPRVTTVDAPLSGVGVDDRRVYLVNVGRW
jgi:hypothetical protein